MGPWSDPLLLLLCSGVPFAGVTVMVCEMSELYAKLIVSYTNNKALNDQCVLTPPASPPPPAPPMPPSPPISPPLPPLAPLENEEPLRACEYVLAHHLIDLVAA